MDEKNQERSRPSLVWPIILITAGVLFLLSNLDILQINFTDLWRLWPILLILTGLEIIIGRRSALGNIVVLVLTLAVIGGVVFILIAAPEVIGSSTAGSEMHILEERANIDQAALQIDFAAGTLNIHQLSDSNALIEGDLELVTDRQPEWEFDQNDDRASMYLGYRSGSFRAWNGRSDTWKIELSPKVDLALNVDVGAGDSNLDLSGLNIRDLTVETGAGRNTVTFPQEGDFAAKVTGGVGQLVIEIPDGMAARIDLSHGLSGISVSNRYDRLGDGLYETDNWDDNQNRVELEVEVGVGQVIIREP